MPALAPRTKLLLQKTSTATLTTQLFRRGFRNAFIQGVGPLGRYPVNMVGPAFTLRYIPAREDLILITPSLIRTRFSAKPLKRCRLTTSL